ncbi:MAG TPA: adenylate/guanylate cyclase domain-containing protein [Actinomycetota bacterium]|nr:adenylate/guanylate cyclase domain-containing protein [Actinomycetota bacterium]
MNKFELQSFDKPNETIEFELGRTEIVQIAEQTVGRTIFRPGWRWSVHMRPHVGTDWCESRHVGLNLSGRFRFLLRDGTEHEVGPHEAYVVPAGHDGWVVGNEPAVQLEWSGLRGWAGELESLAERVLATVLFTDIVDSTATAARLGDRRWQEVLAEFNSDVRDALARFRGREIKTTGDGFLATFDGAARAIRCAALLAETAAAKDLRVRVAVHTGEIEFVDQDARGVAVHEAARIMSLAGPQEVLVSEITRQLAAAANLAFEDRGEHRLKGLEGSRRIYALVR